ncbi:MAG: hypothetical protein MZV70_74740 [Desulfobacterales bacterium]|nr:hypothetical protein [Desulfobacterales bacterium]
MNMALIRGSLLSENELQECVSPFVADSTLQRHPHPIWGHGGGPDRRPAHTDQGRLPAPCRDGEHCLAGSDAADRLGWHAVGGRRHAGSRTLCSRAEMGARTVIGVDVGSRLETPPDLRDGVDVVQRATEIMMLHMRSAGRRACDVLVEPDVGAFSWTDFDRYERIIEAGEQAAQAPAARNSPHPAAWPVGVPDSAIAGAADRPSPEKLEHRHSFQRRSA